MAADCPKCRLVPCLCAKRTRHSDPCLRCKGTGVARCDFAAPEGCFACQGTGLRYRDVCQCHQGVQSVLDCRVCVRCGLPLTR